MHDHSFFFKVLFTYVLQVEEFITNTNWSRTCQYNSQHEFVVNKGVVEKSVELFFRICYLEHQRLTKRTMSLDVFDKLVHSKPIFSLKSFYLRF